MQGVMIPDFCEAERVDMSSLATLVNLLGLPLVAYQFYLKPELFDPY